MALTRGFRETVQARVRSDREFRRGLPSDAVESLLATAANLFNIIACLQEHEGVRLQVVA